MAVILKEVQTKKDLKRWVDFPNKMYKNVDFIKPTISELKNIILNHLELASNYYGENEALLLFRKHLGWYSSGMVGSSEFRNKINRN